MTDMAPPAATTPTWEDPTVHANRWKALGVLCLSLVLIVAGNSALNVAIPTLIRDLEATATEVQWIVDAYALVFAGLLLPAGAIGDRYGRKGAMQGGLLVFAVAAVMATFADSPSQIIVARAIMGIGAAFTMPATLSILTTVFAPKERGKAIAIWAGFAGAGGAIGPIISGLLLERFWFGSVFLINVPIIAVALIGGARLLPTSKDSRQRQLDPIGGLLSMAGLGALLFGIIEGPERGWTNGLTLTGFLVGAAALAGFVWWENRHEDPMLDLSWFRDPVFTVGAVTITLAFFAMFGVFFLSTQYFQFILGLTPLQAGLATLPVAAALVAVAPRSDSFVQRFGTRRVTSSGLAIVAGGLVWLAVTAVPDQRYLLLMPGLVLLGIGMALTTAPSTTLIMTSLPTDKAGVGSAVNDTVREVGGSLGIAILGSVFASVYKQSVVIPGLPAEAQAAARESVAAAFQVAANAPAALGEPLRAAAETGFTDGFSLAFYIGAGVVLSAALIILRALPEDTGRGNDAERRAEAAAS